MCLKDGPEREEADQIVVVGVREDGINETAPQLRPLTSIAWKRSFHQTRLVRAWYSCRREAPTTATNASSFSAVASQVCAMYQAGKESIT